MSDNSAAQKKPEPERGQSVVPDDGPGAQPKKLTKRFQLAYHRTNNFISNELWLADLRTMTHRGQRWIFRLLRMMRMVINMDGFNKISKNAQALTYMSGLAVIPMITVILWLSQGRIANFFQRYKDFDIAAMLAKSDIKLPDALMDSFSSMGKNLPTISAFSFLILLGSVIFLFMGIEDHVNNVYGIKRSRSWPKRFLTWALLIVVTPVLPTVIMAFPGRHFIKNLLSGMRPGLLKAKEILKSSMADGIKTVEDLRPFLDSLRPVKDALFTHNTILVAILAVISISLFFCFIYKLLPYTKVDWLAALISGHICGTIWFLWDVIFVLYVMWPGTTSKIYGSLAIIPFFFLWLYASWLIFLYGAKICYAIQYAPDYDPMVEDGHYAVRELERATCRLVAQLAGRYAEQETNPYHVQQLVSELQVPLRIVEKGLDALETARLVQVKGRDDLERFSNVYLLQDPKNITVSQIQQAVRENGAWRTLPLNGTIQEHIDQLLQSGYAAEKQQLSQISFDKL